MPDVADEVDEDMRMALMLSMQEANPTSAASQPSATPRLAKTGLAEPVTGAGTAVADQLFHEWTNFE